MSQPDDAYTIVIFRGSTAKPLRFSFPLKVVKRAAIIGVLFLVGQLALLGHSVIRTSQVWELQTIRQELTTAKEQTTAFSNSLEDLKRRVQAMKDVNEKLRVMLGLDRLKPEDYLNGQGGEDVPVTPEKEVSLLSEDDQPGDPQESVAYQFWAQDLADQVRHKIIWLEKEAVTQERSLEELTVVAKERSTRWNSTPSVWPVKGWITSGFGPRTSPFTGQLAMHDGLDIGATPNAPVFAPANGRVVATGFDPRMGHMVAVQHGYGIETQYGHLARILVKSGQVIKRGEMLGLVGSTGLSTGPHLHYMVKFNNRPVNPRRYILD